MTQFVLLVKVPTKIRQTVFVQLHCNGRLPQCCFGITEPSTAVTVNCKAQHCQHCQVGSSTLPQALCHHESW